MCRTAKFHICLPKYIWRGYNQGFEATLVLDRLKVMAST